MTQPAIQNLSLEQSLGGTPKNLTLEESLAQQRALALAPPPPTLTGLDAENAALEARTARIVGDRKRLEAQHSKTATILTQIGRGALDAVMAPGALAGAAAESLGAATGLEGVEKFGRELGEASSGAAALSAAPAVPEALAYVFGADSKPRQSTLDLVDKIERDIHEQEKAWPMFSVMSRLVGTAGAALGTGALAGLAAGGVAAPGMAASVGSAAVEGAEFGAQAAYEHDAPLQDVLTASVIGAAISGGTVFGLHEAFKAFKGHKTLAEKANEAQARALGGTASDFQKVRDMDAMGEAIRTHKLNDGTMVGANPGSILPHNIQSLQPRVTLARKEVGEAIGELRTMAGKAADPDLTGFWAKAKGLQDALLKSDDGAEREMADSLFKNIKGMAEDLEKGTAVKMDRLLSNRKKLDESIFGYEKAFKVNALPEYSVKNNSLRALRDILDDSLDEHVSKTLGAEQLKRYVELKRVYSQFAIADKIMERSVGRATGNRSPGGSLSDVLAGTAVAGGSIASGDVFGVAKGLAASIIHGQIRTRGNAFLATFYSRLLQDSTRPAIRLLLPAAEGTAVLATKTGEHAFIEHAREAATEGIRRVPKTTIAAGISHFLPRPAREQLSVAEQQKQYSERLDRLSRLSAMPEDAATAAILGALPPEMAAVVGVAFSERLKQLLADMPKPQSSLRGKAYETLPSDDVRKGNAMWEATVDPMSVFADYKAGDVDYDKVKYAWKQYPGMKEMLQVALLDALQAQLTDAQKQAIPETTWTQIDYLLGFGGQLQGSVNPDFSARMDQLGAQDRNQEKKQGARRMNLPTAKKTFTERMMAHR